MQKLFNRLNLSQRLALVCGGLCLLVSLILVAVGSFSSRYILLQQEAEYGDMVALESAREISNILARGDLIGMEVNLERLVSLNQLRGIRVYDVEQRQIGAAGADTGAIYTTEILLDGKEAGRLRIYLRDNTALAEQRSMAMSVLMLAIVLSLFVTVLCSRLSHRYTGRLLAIAEKLRLGQDGGVYDDELAALEAAVEELPLELLQPRQELGQELADYETVGLLYVRLDSLASYVETLDESTLLRYTLFQNELIAAAAELYDGEILVVRQFGILVCFAGQHKSGSPVFRAVCSAWLIRLLAGSLQSEATLKLDLSLCCGLSEAGAIHSGDFYSALYCQHIIDEMEQTVIEMPEAIALTDEVAADASIANTTHLAKGSTGHSSLSGFPAPTDNLVERQHQLLLAQLREKL